MVLSCNRLLPVILDCTVVAHYFDLSLKEPFHIGQQEKSALFLLHKFVSFAFNSDILLRKDSFLSGSAEN